MLQRCARDVIRVLSPHVEPKRLQRYDQVLDLRTSKACLVLENISDYGNAAACLRSAEAFGIQNVHIIESYQKFEYAGGIDRGTSRWLSLMRYKHAKDALDALRKENFAIWASALSPTAVPLEKALADATSTSNPQPIALIFGNESRGTSKFLQLTADTIFQIPMVGFVESFNLSVAVGITLQSCRMHRKLEPNLRDSEKDELKARWLLADVVHSKHILARNNIELDDY